MITFLFIRRCSTRRILKDEIWDLRICSFFRLLVIKITDCRSHYFSSYAKCKHDKIIYILQNGASLTTRVIHKTETGGYFRVDGVFINLFQLYLFLYWRAWVRTYHYWKIMTKKYEIGFTFVWRSYCVICLYVTVHFLACDYLNADELLVYWRRLITSNIVRMHMAGINSLPYAWLMFQTFWLMQAR